ncbi:MAG: TetR/AcrR family transcriptional regulator [Roseiflexaceae bacterium]
MKHETTKNNLIDQRRMALLDAAADLLATNPSASLAEIAAHAKIGKATLHRYFESREALVLALALRSLAAIQQAIAASRPAEGPLDQALLRLAEALVPLGDKLHFLLSEPMIDQDPTIDLADRDAQAELRAALHERQTRGELREDLSIDWILQSMNWLLFAMWHALQHGMVARRDAPKMLVTTLLGGIAASE